MSSKPVQIPAPQALAFTLRQQNLHRAKLTPLNAVRRMVAVQSQYDGSVPLALWARCPGVAVDWVEQAIEKKRTLIKSWSLRMTLHVQAAEDWPLIVGAGGGPWLEWFYQGLSKWTGMQRGEITKRLNGIARALKGQPRSRRALHERVPTLVSPDGSMWGYDVKGLAFRGELLIVGREGAQPVFAHREQWLADQAWEPPAPEQALYELARRYLSAYGPASVQDFAHWSGLQVKNGKKAFAGIADELVPVEVEGQRQPVFVLEQELNKLRRAGQDVPAVVLLPKFDVLLLARKDKSWLVDDQYYKRIHGKAGQVEAAVLLSGRAAATWRIKRGKTLIATVAPFTPLGKSAQKQVEREFSKLAHWLGSTDMRVEYS